MKLSDTERLVYRRYAELALPRHTSYPAVPYWHDCDNSLIGGAIERSNDLGRDLSIYVHVPFCERLCYYCTCTKEITPRRDPAKLHAITDAYLARLCGEVERVAKLVGGGRTVQQVHLGGGTPTFLSSVQLVELSQLLRREFTIAPDAELSIEVDPRVTPVGQLATLRAVGFNRVSLGVQDFEPCVQVAVNRVQPAELVAEFTDACRRLGFHSINFDLIYGMPFQTPESV